MEGLSRAVGAGIPHFILGEMRMLYPMRLCDWGALEQWILSQRSESLDVAVTARRAIGPEVAKVLREEVRSIGRVSNEEFNAFVSTDFAIHLSLWMCLRFSVPFEECQNVGRDDAKEFVRVRDQISGVDIMSSFDWKPDFDEDDNPTKETKGWLATIKSIAEAWCPGLSPSQIGELTFHNFRILTSDFDQLAGRRKKMPMWKLEGYLKKKREYDEKAFF